MPKELILALLLHPVFWEDAREESVIHKLDYQWAQVATLLVKEYPETSATLADKILHFFGDQKSIGGRANDYVKKLLAQAIEQRARILASNYEVLGRFFERTYTCFKRMVARRRQV